MAGILALSQEIKSGLLSGREESVWVHDHRIESKRVGIACRAATEDGPIEAAGKRTKKCHKLFDDGR